MISPDGTQLAASFSNDKTSFVQIWSIENDDPGNPEFVEVRRLPHSKVRNLDWSEDGSRLVSLSRSGMMSLLKKWNSENFELEWEKEISSTSRDVKISPRNDWIAVACLKKVVVIDALSLDEFEIGNKSDYTVYSCVDFSNGGEFLTAGDTDRGIRIWKRSAQPPYFNHVLEKRAHKFSISACRFDRENGNYLATASVGGRVRLWRLENDSELTLDADLLADTHKNKYPQVTSLAFSGRGDYLLTGQERGSVRLWNLGKAPHQNLGGTGNVEALDFHPGSGRLIAGRISEPPGVVPENLWEIREDEGGEKLGDPQASCDRRSDLKSAMDLRCGIRSRFSRDGEKALVFRRPENVSDSSLFLYEIPSGNLIAEVPGD